MVSVIIPTYNREQLVIESIRSVLEQTYSDLELIVVDDCSTDNTAQCIKAIGDKRIKYYCLEKNSGACVARNLGIEVSKGEYIAFQDSDDLWYPRKLEIQLRTLNESGADVCFHKLLRHYLDNTPDDYFPALDRSAFKSHQEMCNYTLISTQTILGHRKVFMEHQFDPMVKKAQDYDWGVRASRNYLFYYLDEALVEQRFQMDSISGKGVKAILESRMYFLEKYKNEFKDNPSFEIKQLLKVAKCKTILNTNATKEYYRIFQIRKKPRDYAKYIFSKCGVMGLLYKMNGVKNESLPGIEKLRNNQ